MGRALPGVLKHPGFISAGPAPPHREGGQRIPFPKSESLLRGCPAPTLAPPSGSPHLLGARDPSSTSARNPELGQAAGNLSAPHIPYNTGLCSPWAEHTVGLGNC